MSTVASLLNTLLEDRDKGKPLNTGICRYLEEHHGRRFCKLCAKLLPVSSFKRGQRVYTCLAHRSEPTARRDPRETTRTQTILNMHAMARRDRSLFAQPTMLLTPGEMDMILIQQGLTDPHEAARWSLVPWDPTRPMSNANYRLLSKMRRRTLLSKWSSSGTDPYIYNATLLHMLTQ
jgi:hypothetical protein